ncbi:hypothetical protein [Neptuniibacter sp.]|uniref:hypothetical protein n=1 Tax=Neptuniibacter sp. TaxID=1962643 RepID=UPI002613D85B|nr:hypothetical protein [Neptuniibacter sp.]MCP4596695.1 hypothetical protein [Neptuniibacter sp.]
MRDDYPTRAGVPIAGTGAVPDTSVAVVVIVVVAVDDPNAVIIIAMPLEYP